MPSQKNSTSTGTSLKCDLQFPPNFDASDFCSQNGFVNKKLLPIIVPPYVDLIPRAVQKVTQCLCSTDLPRRSKICICKSANHSFTILCVYNGDKHCGNNFTHK